MALTLFVVVQKGDEGNAESGPEAWQWDEDVLAALMEDGQLEGCYGPPEGVSKEQAIFFDEKEAARQAIRFCEEDGEQWVVFAVELKPAGMWVTQECGLPQMSRGMADVLAGRKKGSR